MEHSDWLAAVTKDSVRNVALTVGLPPRTLATQLQKERLSPENVIRIAEAYEVHPVGALVDTGYLDEKWAEQVDPVMAARQLSDEQVADEVLRRLREVRGNHEPFRTPVSDLDERRSNTRQPHVDPMPYGAVADSSPDEDELRAQEEGDVD